MGKSVKCARIYATSHLWKTVENKSFPKDRFSEFTLEKTVEKGKISIF